MFILPYLYHRTSLGSVILHEWNLLTVSGIRLWKEEDMLRLKEDILEPNGFILRSEPRRMNDLMLCELDDSKLDMSDYYRWEELTTEQLCKDDVFCWRKYYSAGPSDDLRASIHSQWLPPPESHVLSNESYRELFYHLLQHHLSTS